MALSGKSIICLILQTKRKHAYCELTYVLFFSFIFSSCEARGCFVLVLNHDGIICDGFTIIENLACFK